MKAGEVYVQHLRTGVDHYILIRKLLAQARAEIVYINDHGDGEFDCGAGIIRLSDIFFLHAEPVRIDWTAWAEMVGKLTDYLLALPSEAME